MPDPGGLKPLFLLSDEPIGGHAQNAFADDPFARTVAQATLGTTGPFTIGVYGGWGSGKTSALHAARTMIDADPAWSHIVTVEFNAWRYEREEHPIVPLVATIERAVTEKLNDEKALRTKIGDAAVEGFKLFKRTTRSLLSMTSGEIGGKVKFPFVADAEAKLSIDPGKAVEAWDKAAEAESKAHETEWSRAVSAALYKSVFDQLGLLATDAQSDKASETTNFPRVVVFIDDLDRCQADTAFDLLESVKLVLCQPGFVFVLALNHAVVDGYLSYRAEKLYGKDKAVLHKSYLEKIVQLPLTMPSRSERFTGFTTHLLDARLSKAVDSDLRAGLKTLAKVLALSANRTPRSLVRRINTALIDIALRDPAMLPDSLKREAGACPNFSGLCIVQRTLEAALGPEMTRTLAIDNALCEVIAKGNIWGINEALKGSASDKATERAGAGERDERAKAAWSRVFDAIWSDPANNFLWNEDEDHASKKIVGSSVFTSPEGKRWLTQHAERRAIMRITVQRPDAETAAPLAEKKPEAADITTATAESKSSASGRFRLEISDRQHLLIQREIRRQLQLSADAPLGPDEWNGIISLSFLHDPITDAGVAWLARHDSVLNALTSLDLEGTRVTDEGVKALASAETGLKALASLDLTGTKITDQGVKALASAETGLKALTSLDLEGTQVTDEGVKALASAETGLKAITALHLTNTKVTDEGMMALASAETGLKALAWLVLRNTRVTDAGVRAIKKRLPKIRINR